MDEMEDPRGSTDLIALSRTHFRDMRRRLVATLGRLSPEDLAWRPNEASNSAANLVLHICGNVRQRFHAGFGAAVDDRDRRAEFGDRAVHDAASLIRLVEEHFDEADALLGSLSPDALGEVRTIQGAPQTLAFVLTQVLGHYGEHLGQIMYIGKARLGGGFERLWPPPRKPA
jgi:uncharacterized damage-inducible protein DinB